MLRTAAPLLPVIKSKNQNKYSEGGGEILPILPEASIGSALTLRSLGTALGC